MTKRNKLIIFFVLINILTIIFVSPIIPAFYGMNALMKVIYIILGFGFPLLIVFPISIITSPFAYILSDRVTFFSKWRTITSTFFLVVSILIFVLNSILLVSKFGLGNDVFSLTKYSEIKGYEGDTSDLKIGEFYFNDVTINRTTNKQIQTDKNDDEIYLIIKWISENEYLLVFEGKNTSMNSEMMVKITDNKHDYYDCYAKYGDYAQFYRIFKKQIK